MTDSIPFIHIKHGDAGYVLTENVRPEPYSWIDLTLTWGESLFSFSEEPEGNDYLRIRVALPDFLIANDLIYEALSEGLADLHQHAKTVYATALAGDRKSTLDVLPSSTKETRE